MGGDAAIPGYENTETGIAAYEASLQEDEDIGVYINEFMASNATTVADAYGAYSDWIELYNSNAYEVDLSGFGISDSISQPKKYTLPEGTVIPANGYLVIFCSGNEGLTESGELHAPFGLRAYAEDVVFSSKRGTSSIDIPIPCRKPIIPWPACRMERANSRPPRIQRRVMPTMTRATRPFLQV